jgi:hypothetical protein
MAKVPDLGTDFAQKLLKDLRQRRERLGFESTNNINIVPRGKFSCSPAFFEKCCQSDIAFLNGSNVFFSF